jgi:hypothetical protein
LIKHLPFHGKDKYRWSLERERTTERKNRLWHHVFAATMRFNYVCQLSVYFGLLLIAAPSIVAQSSSAVVKETTTGSPCGDNCPRAASRGEDDDDETNNKTCQNEAEVEVKPQTMGAAVAEEEGDDDEEEDQYDDDDESDDEDDDSSDDEEEGLVWELDDWGKPQCIGLSEVENVADTLEAMRRYMKEVVVGVDPAFSEGKGYQCRNYQTDCLVWAAEGNCETNYDYMLENCSPACQSCDEYLEEHYEPDIWDDDNAEDEDQPDSQTVIGTIQPTPWGVPQHMGDTVPLEALQALLDATHTYMTESVLSVPDEYGHILHECENKHPDCTFWAATGLCEEERIYMQLQCAPACQSCDQLEYTNRCPVDPNAEQVFAKPGELNAMFQRIITDPQWAEQYGPLEIVSSPETTGGPWIITLESFVSEEESTRFIELGHDIGYERSEDVSNEEETLDGTFDSVESEGRTSTNSWCYEDCVADPIVQPVHARIEALTGTHHNNSECKCRS